MPKPRVQEIVRMFKGHFQKEDVPIPVALRHESIDVVFTSLLEDDARSPESPTPMPLDAMFDESPDMGLDMGMLDEGMGMDAGMGGLSQMPMPDDMMGL